MNLSSYVDTLRHELLVAAEAGGADARALAERLTAPLDSAARLVLLEALSAAADEITRDLAPGSVDVRLRGRDPAFVVTPPPSEEAFDDTDDAPPGAAPPNHGPPNDPMAPATDHRQSASVTGPADDDGGTEGGTSRINLRLPDPLKLAAEAAASREGLSVNAWLVRAVVTVLEPDDRHHPRRRSPRSGQRYTGWVR